MNDYQGKRPKQVRDSENFAFWALLLFAVSVLVLLLTT